MPGIHHLASNISYFVPPLLTPELIFAFIPCCTLKWRGYTDSCSGHRHLAVTLILSLEPTIVGGRTEI